MCEALQPHLAHMRPHTLAAVALSVGRLGPQQPAAWLEHLVPAISAAAAAAATASPAAGGAAPVPLPPQALVQLLQALLLLRARPPLALLRRLIALSARDMLLYRGSELVGLLLVCVQLRLRPGGAWIRSALLRLQGKLRMLSFDELTQVGGRLGCAPAGMPVLHCSAVLCECPACALMVRLHMLTTTRALCAHAAPVCRCAGAWRSWASCRRRRGRMTLLTQQQAG